MSYLAMRWALRSAPAVDTYERAILVCLADRASLDGRGCFESVPNLAEAAVCDTETVKRRLRALLRRGVIGFGDQTLVEHLPAGKRPKVYDLLIPYAWYSAGDLAKANEECLNAKKKREPLTPANRPPLAPAPSKEGRADKGVPNPKRRHKKPAAQAALQEPSSGDDGSQRAPSDGSDRAPTDGSPRALGDGSLSSAVRALVEPQTSPGTGPLKNNQPAGPEPAQPAGWLAGDTSSEEPRQDGGVLDSAGARLLRGLTLFEPKTRAPMRVTDQVVRQHHEWVTELLVTWQHDALAAHLVAGFDDPGILNPLGLLVSRIRNTAPRPAQVAPVGQAGATEREWCGRDGSNGEDPCDRKSRQRQRPDGKVYRCECHWLADAPEQRKPPAGPRPDHPATPPAADEPTRAGSPLAALGLDPAPVNA